MRLRRKLLIFAFAIGILFLLVIAAVVAVFFSPLLTRYVEGDAFRVVIKEETANGLHFPKAHYAPIRRTGVVTAHSDSFEAADGQKAIKSLNAHGITAKFDPWGVLLRQWRFTDVQVQSGDVGIQIYKANPEAVPGRPWFAIFCRTEFTCRKFNPTRPTSRGASAVNERVSSERNCLSRLTVATSITMQRAGD